jgi:hypothetical protein
LRGGWNRSGGERAAERSVYIGFPWLDRADERLDRG